MPSDPWPEKLPASVSRLTLALTILLLSMPWRLAGASDLPEVVLAEVERSEIIEEVSLTGTVNALRSSALSTPVAGLVNEVTVETGDRVTQGDALIRLDPELEEQALASARAETREAAARLAEARRRLEEAESVGVGRNIAQTEVRTRESEVATAEATAARLQATERRQQAVVRRHRIEAPFDGVVSHRYSDLGEWVNPGDELLELVDIGNLRLDFRVPQQYYSRLDERATLEVAVRGADQSPVTAAILTVVPVNDAEARTFLIRADQPQGLVLLPGTALSATLRLLEGEDGLSIPRDAVNRYPEGRTTVWVATPDGDDAYRVTEKRIRIGASYDDRVVISDGLQQGERVVTRGNESLEQDMRVTLAEQEGS